MILFDASWPYQYISSINRMLKFKQVFLWYFLSDTPDTSLELSELAIVISLFLFLLCNIYWIVICFILLVFEKEVYTASHRVLLVWESFLLFFS